MRSRSRWPLGKNRTRCCIDYAALLKTLCLVPPSDNSMNASGSNRALLSVCPASLKRPNTKQGHNIDDLMRIVHRVLYEMAGSYQVDALGGVAIWPWEREEPRRQSCGEKSLRSKVATLHSAGIPLIEGLPRPSRSLIDVLGNT